MSQATNTTLQENPFVQLWDDIKAEAIKVGDELKVLAVEVEQEVVADIKEVFRVGAPLAVAAILKQAPLLISGQEKFGNAVTSVGQDLQVQLGPVAWGDVQSLVQTAFTGLSKIANSP